MISINLPAYDTKTTLRNGKTLIFDFLRRRYVTLTPEEWVRQHFTHFLITHRHYPAGLLANEVSLNVGGVARRCDSVLYDRNGGRPRVLIEYKAPHVKITQEVFTQIASYNSVLHADYLFVSNGLQHICCRLDYAANSYAFLPEVPDFADL